jgi:hypothetical protein
VDLLPVEEGEVIVSAATREDHLRPPTHVSLRRPKRIDPIVTREDHLRLPIHVLLRQPKRIDPNARIEDPLLLRTRVSPRWLRQIDPVVMNFVAMKEDHLP